jgi:hypothetical protein
MTLLAFKNYFPDDALLNGGENMTYPKGERVEPGIELIGRNPNRYKVTVSMNKGRAKLCGTVTGNINAARDLKYELRRQLKQRSLKSKGKIKNIWGALVYYVLVEYHKTAQYREGSGAAKVRYWLLRIGKKEIAELCAADLNQAIIDLRSRGLKESAIIPYISFFKTAMKQVKMLGKIDLPKDVFDDVKEITADPVEKFYIDQADIDRIVAKLPEWSRPFTTFKRLVPSRLEELYDALASDIDLDKRRIKLRHTKAGVERSVPIPEIMMPYFKEAKASGSKWAFYRVEDLKDREKIFLPLSRNHLSGLFSEARDSLNLNSKLCLRHLRHDAIRNYMKAGVSTEVIAGIAGNTPETIHRHYAHISDMAQQDAVKKAAEWLNNQGKAVAV